jgi:nucleoside-diphosphate-sugar epimerase
MVSVVVSGSHGRTGRRLVAHLEADPSVDRVVRLPAEATAADLKPLVEGASAVIHLGAATDVGAALEAASSASITQFVYRSSAAVYGAWADNALPLTEDVPLRPNPGFSFAVEHAEAERLVGEWADDHTRATVAVLRAAPVVAPGGESWESSTLGRPSSLRRGDALAPAQFLHVDDAAAAFAHAFSAKLEGTFNLAPDGWVAGETARALASSGTGVTVPLPDRVAVIAERWAWRLGLGGAPAPASPYLAHPWVVANDRLRATGWSPEYTNEEALVASRKGTWWRELSPQRRQELALGVTGAALAGLAAAVVFGLRRGAKRPASRPG